MIPPIPIYAWGWTPNPARLDEWRDMIPGLRIVHYPRTYHLARPGDAAIVDDIEDAELAVKYADKWSFVILGDERNTKGPSGEYETPAEYSRRLGHAEVLLEDAGITTSACGLAARNGEFAGDYLANITIGQHRAHNGRPVSWNNVIRGVQQYVLDNPKRKWFITSIPVRLNLWPLRYFTLGSFLWQQLFVWPRWSRQMKQMRDMPFLLGIGVWCLREGKLGDGHWQGWHGLVDRNDNLTWQGRFVKRLLAQG